MSDDPRPQAYDWDSPTEAEFVADVWHREHSRGRHGIREWPRTEPFRVRETERAQVVVDLLARRRSRRVKTGEELDALPHQAVVIEEPHGHVWIRHSDKWHCSCDGTSVEWSSDEVFGDLACGDQPLTVLWIPEETPE